ncbi:MAG TPA: molybdopterin cofactor-binding domain-containing protein, partial [Novosphingobium sp.]|nr:molybdopterin cofactor-binding domain-containing protein [Novosphingobium sp.]
MAPARPPVAPRLPMAFSRRRLLVGAAAGGGLLVAWALSPRRYPVPVPPAAGEAGFGAWLRIGRDGVVTVAVPQLEMGQGITTLLPQVVAMELGADWRMVAAEPQPVSEIFANPPLARRWAQMWLPQAQRLGPPGLWLARRWAEHRHFSATADGLSLAAYELPARRAAAAARCLLQMAAARQWGVDWQACEAAGGAIRHGASKLGFGALAEAASRLALPRDVPLRAAPAQDPADPAAVAFPRLDLPAKLAGRYPFAGDIRLPGLLYAAIRHAPVGAAARLAGHEGARAKGIAGFRQLVEGPDWLAAVADNGWAAEQALAAIAPRFVVQAPADSTRAEAALDHGLKAGTAQPVASAGDAAAHLGAHAFSQRYEVAAAFHAPLETATATARLASGPLGLRGAEVWVASQAPG